MKKRLQWIAFVAIAIILVSSCKKGEPEEQDEVTILNNWIWDVMNDIYLWADEIPPSLYPQNEPDPKAFFYKILNDDDRFSWIVEDIYELEASFAGIELSNGISPGWIQISGTDQVIAVVEFVYEGSPAADSGIQRGDIILEINGEELTKSNYISKFYQETATYSFGEINTSGLVLNGESTSLTAVVLEQNPVQHHEIIQYEGKKIGYLVYTHFTAGEVNIWLHALDDVLESFLQESVDDVIIDIRYNPGGNVDIAEHIAASLVPPVNVIEKDVFTRFIWNTEFNSYFKDSDLNEDGKADGEESDWLVLNFKETPYNLNLSNVYFLTSYRSASACELLIIGVDAYNNVVHIGDNTVGKFYGSITIGDTEEPERHIWAMQPLVFKYANAVGYTDFVDGLTPDHYIKDDLIHAVPFGDLRDPMLAKAMEEITGVAPVTKKSAQQSLPYTNMPDPIREIVKGGLRLSGTPALK